MSAPHDDPVLQVCDLHVEVKTPTGWLDVVQAVNLSLFPGRTLGLVGESGSGKSMTAFAIAGLLPRTARLAGGEVNLDGVDLSKLDDRALADVRGRSIGVIFQEPRRSLNPALTVGRQVSEAIRRHQRVSKRAAQRSAVEMLSLVRIPHAERRVDEYPHAFSGGMCQRVMLAIALACQPKVLVADEPTTALDVTVQASVLDLICDLQDEMGLAVLLITHDLGVVAERSDELAVMYAGRIVEQSDTASVFGRPRHPYSDGLIRSIPDVTRPLEGLTSIAGEVPALDGMPSGCRFHTRCPYAIAACETDDPPLRMSDLGHWSACLRSAELTLSGVGHG